MFRLSASVYAVFVSHMAFRIVSGRPRGDPLDPFLSGPEQALVGAYMIAVSLSKS
jgi:hypothetical protein